MPPFLTTWQPKAHKRPGSEAETLVHRFRNAMFGIANIRLPHFCPWLAPVPEWPGSEDGA